MYNPFASLKKKQEIFEKKLKEGEKKMYDKYIDEEIKRKKIYNILFNYLFICLLCKRICHHWVIMNRIIYNSSIIFPNRFRYCNR